LVREFAASGLSRREFCEGRGLKVSTLDGYRKRLRQRERDGAGAGADRWVAVDIAGATRPAGASGISAKPHAWAAGASGVVMVLGGGRRIELERGFDAVTLGALLRVLERS